MFGFGKYFGAEAYINSVVDDVVNHCRALGISGALSRDDVKSIISDRYRVHGLKSVRSSVLNREVMDYLDDNYFSTKHEVNLENLILVIILKEKLAVAVDPNTNDIISARLSLF